MYHVIWARGMYSYAFCHEFRKMLQKHVFGGTPRLLQNYIAGSKKLSQYYMGGGGGVGGLLGPQI